MKIPNVADVNRKDEVEWIALSFASQVYSPTMKHISDSSHTRRFNEIQQLRRSQRGYRRLLGCFDDAAVLYWQQPQEILKIIVLLLDKPVALSTVLFCVCRCDQVSDCVRPGMVVARGNIDIWGVAAS